MGQIKVVLIFNEDDERQREFFVNVLGADVQIQIVEGKH